MRTIQKTEYTKSSQKTDRVKLVKDFLTKYYEVKVNIFNSEMSYIRCTDANPLKEQHWHFPPTRKDIALHLESENIRGCKYILNDILESPAQVTPYNPIHEYLESLTGKWKGESQIDKLCSYIRARDFGDRADGFYQERFARIFKKWLVACVACWMGECPNDVIFGLLSNEEGIGKTRLIEFLIPDELKLFYIKAKKEDNNFDPSRAFAQKAFVNFDELNGIKKASIETIKDIVSSKDINIKHHTFKRIANCALTSNKTREEGGFMTGEIRGRRFGLVEVAYIDFKSYSKTIDVQQIWAEAYELYKNADFDYHWGKADYNDFNHYNERYIKETNAVKLIKENYRIPTADDGRHIIYKQATEIIQELRRARRIPAGVNDISEVTIGRALSQLKFNNLMKKRNGENRYCWEVVQLYGEEFEERNRKQKEPEQKQPETEPEPEQKTLQETKVEQFVKNRQERKKKPKIGHNLMPKEKPKKSIALLVDKKPKSEEKLCPGGLYKVNGKCDDYCAKHILGCHEIPINKGYLKFDNVKHLIRNPDLLSPKYRKMYDDYINLEIAKLET